VDVTVAISAERNWIFTDVVAQQASRADLVHLQSIGTTSILASPTATLDTAVRSYSFSDTGSDSFFGDSLFSKETNSRPEAGMPTLPSLTISLAPMSRP
jgi:hypothetical protein